MTVPPKAMTQIIKTTAFAAPAIAVIDEAQCIGGENIRARHSQHDDEAQAFDARDKRQQNT